MRLRICPIRPMNHPLVTVDQAVPEPDDAPGLPGHVFLVMLNREEAEGLLAQLHALIEVQARIGETRYDAECHCCREVQQILSEFQAQLLAVVPVEKQP